MGFHLLIPVSAGVVGAVLLAAYARSVGRRADRVYAGGLVVAALIYVGFALFNGAAPHALGLEGVGVVLFTGFAVAGLRGHPLLLAVGWALHMVWDLYLHPADGGGYAPWWYPVACVGFDLWISGFIAGSFFRNRSDRSTEA